MLNDFIATIKDKDTIWVMENKENSDRIFKDYVTDKLFSSTYIIVSKDIAYVFVHKLDEGNIKVLKNQNCKIFIYDTNLVLIEKIKYVLDEHNYPKNILLSYTTMSDNNTDIITYSTYVRITKLFRKLYKENNKKISFKSAQMNIYDIISKNSNDDIKKLKVLASITDEILKESFNEIKEYQTEIEIAQNTKKIMRKYMDIIKEKYNIIDYDLAWDICPIVLVGKNLKKGGHALPTDNKIVPGDTISPKQSKRANLKLVENGVYTLEPRINIENGGSIEEMILITKNGAIPLCNIQKELYLI